MSVHHRVVASILSSVMLLSVGGGVARAEPDAVAVRSADADAAGSPVREDREIFSVGASVFAASYVGSVLAASHSYASDSDTKPVHTELYLPVVGPFQSVGGGRSSSENALLVADGLAQGAGLALVVYSIVAARRDHAAARRTHVEPMVGVATGAQVTGHF